MGGRRQGEEGGRERMGGRRQGEEGGRELGGLCIWREGTKGRKEEGEERGRFTNMFCGVGSRVQVTAAVLPLRRG